MLALFPAMSYKAWYAIGEFVDNALQSWKANHKQLVEAFGDRARLEIEVEFNEASKTIIVSDNAAGISATADSKQGFLRVVWLVGARSRSRR